MYATHSWLAMCLKPNECGGKKMGWWRRFLHFMDLTPDVSDFNYEEEGDGGDDYGYTSLMMNVDPPCSTL